MKKTNSITLGITPCDLCNNPSASIVGTQILCKEHVAALHEKRADAILSLKGASILLADVHKQK